MTEQPTRVRVTAPRRTTTGRRRRSVAAEIDAQTTVGEIYLRSLIRSQLRLGLGVLLLLTLTVGMLPLVFRFVPAVRDAHVHGYPLPWVVLGFAVYPYLVAVAWGYRRRAERIERDFEALLEERP